LPESYSGNFYLQIFAITNFKMLRSKKIYFAGSIRGGREDAALYAEIILHMKQFGIVLTEHVGYPGHISHGDEQLTDEVIYERDMNWLISCDAVVAEVTTVSTGVGFELGQAVASGKKVLCLFRPQSGLHLSAMIAGCPGLQLENYTEPSEAMSAVTRFLNKNL
jgi:2'-deoxynucleoside 5'-phosphate N-hydrolase